MAFIVDDRVQVRMCNKHGTVVTVNGGSTYEIVWDNQVWAKRWPDNIQSAHIDGRIVVTVPEAVLVAE